VTIPLETGIHHGSCLDLIPQLPDRSVNCIVTDPPYGVNFWSRSAVTPEGKAWVKKVANDESLDGALALFAEVMATVEPKVKDECDVYIFTRWDIVGAWIEAVKAVPWLQYKMLLIWDKGSPGMGDIDSNWGCGHELILYCKKGRREVAYRRSGILAHDRVAPRKAIHPTEKPVPLLETLIDMSTARGDVVLDPFSGSGSTTVAAKNTGRIGIGFEQDADHYERSLGRLSQGVLF
jgi:adenine-specific DNA-methyltransferase